MIDESLKNKQFEAQIGEETVGEALAALFSALELVPVAGIDGLYEPKPQADRHKENNPPKVNAHPTITHL